MLKIFNTFQDLKSFDFSNEPEINKVSTLGHTILSIGAAEYVKTINNNFVRDDESEFNTIDGSSWKIISNFIKPEHFGAIPETEASVPRLEQANINSISINKFFNYISEVNIGTALFTGSFVVDSSLFLGRKNDGDILIKVATEHIIGSPKIKYIGTEKINSILTINGFSMSRWDGRISVRGSGGLTWKARNTNYCVRINGCSRSVFGGFICEEAASFGLLCSSELFPSGNCSLLNLGDCRFSACGSGSGNSNSAHFMQSTWTSAELSRFPDLRFTNLSVDQLPTREMLERSRSNPFIIFENGEVSSAAERNSIDYNTNTIEIRPSINPNLLDKNIKWVFGGGIALRGSDVGIVHINSIDAVNSAIALDVITFYGPVVGRLVVQYCFAGFVLNNTTTSILAMYGEGEQVPFIKLAPTSGTNISAMHNVRLDKIIYLTDRNGAGELVNYNGLHGTTFIQNGRVLTHEKKSNNIAEAHSRIDFILDEKNKNQTYKLNNVVIGLEINKTYNEVFGYDSGQLTIVGTGQNQSPLGSVTFKPLDPGNNVNGRPSIVFNSFNKAPIFNVYFDIGENNFYVTELNQ